jgi:DNA-binding NarL/FixJ family response regulator
VTEQQRVKVFLLDDHELVRRGLRDLLEPEPDLEIVGEASTAAEALRRILPCGRTSPCSMRGSETGRGSTSCREVRPRCGDGGADLTSFADDDALFAAIMAGAPATC